MRLLLIEDDRDIALALVQALRATYATDIAACGKSGLASARGGGYALIILDLNLPDLSGYEVCKRLKQQGCSAPILILSGEASVMSKINLLDAGAEDYLTKPFSLGELKVRLRVLERRLAGQPASRGQLHIGELQLDSDRHCVSRRGQAIILRRKEFALLECLMQRAGTVVTREMLCTHAWRENEDPWTNTIDVHIKYLRDKIDRPFSKPLIKTVHGLGYKLEISPNDSSRPAEPHTIES